MRALVLAWAVAAAGAACLVSPAARAAESAPADAAAPPATAAAAWLERMNRALTSRNYDGTFSHWQGGTVQMLRIIHRLQDGKVAERLVSLDGSGREFVRAGETLTCYLPDRRTVLVERRPSQQSLVSFPAVNGQTASYYDIREVARMRLNRRDTHLITIAPRDQYRYGYRLWIDDATAMPLKTQLCDAGGHVIEQIVFANLTMPARIADSAFKPEVATEGFQWLRNTAATSPPQQLPPAWSALKLPPGFRMMVRGAQTLPGSTTPVDQLVFTDGLASVSVFVEIGTAGGGTVPEPQTACLGSSCAFSTWVDGRKVTAVGEVPPATVRFFATQLRAAGAAPTPAVDCLSSDCARTAQ
ncbi:MAG TPA: MucB/RseB C-terminal domain-containing protein [Steroidobacteraceae bacterium]|nr:MucB/RseB C-terminal domain-containing protein [Steroidobacteraceae bacterium]